MVNKVDIIQDILNNKLFIDDRGNLYGDKYSNYLSNNTGLWQMPEELADLILFLQDKNIKSFLNIGTFNGLTFNLLSKYLILFNQDCRCISIDPINHNPIINDSFEYYSYTSNNYIGNNFDLVFIDGEHSYDGVKTDFNNVGIYSKYCVFHDIEDIYVQQHPDNYGGVPIFWNEIKLNYQNIEFKENNKPNKIMGIGLIYGK